MSVVEFVATADEGVQRADSAPLAEPPTNDEELLRRFVDDRDELAFARLVTQHAALVMGVCRRTLGDEQDAEDAFQATFLVLARKAASVRRANALSAWLYQTSYRIALRARATRSRRKEQPLEVDVMTVAETFSRIAGEREQAVLDEELNRLPEKYRRPLFLCCIEGKSREEAAEQLGLSSGAVKGLLERGRNLLRRRLMLRGVSLSIALGLMAGLQQTAQAAPAVSPALVASTVQAGVQYASGHAAMGLVTQNALSLANGSFQIMSITTAKLLAGCLVVCGTLTVLANWLPAPVIAGDADGGTVTLVAAQRSSNVEVLATAVAFAATDEGEGRRRSAEGEAGPRRAAEDEGRRSPEADAPPRRSAEGDAGPRRAAEGEREAGRPAEGAGRDAAENPLQGFKPQTPREAALYQMILQLQREVADLRRSVRSQAEETRNPLGARDGEQPGRSDGAETAPLPARWQFTTEGKVFKAYDKNGDSYVSLEEYLAMTNGNINAARRELQTKRFLEANPGSDGKLSPAEFIQWRTGGQSTPRRGGGEDGRSTEGEAGARRSPEGEGRRRSAESEDR